MNRVSRLLLGLMLVPVTAPAQFPPAMGSVPCRYRPTPVAPEQALARAWDAVGLARLGDSVVQLTVSDQTALMDQSDRAYPPFLAAFGRGAVWFDPGTGTERWEPAGGRPIILTAHASFAIRDSVPVADARLYSRLRPWRTLDPWAVLADWRAAARVRALGLCRYRDYPRLVLERNGAEGRERLFLDRETWFPVALVREEANYLLGQVLAEYVYQSWWEVGGAYYPLTATRMQDGYAERARSVFPGQAVVRARAAAPAVVLPGSVSPVNLADVTHFPEAMPDTVRAGQDAFLLANAAFTSVIAQAGETVFVLDATASEHRARQDARWVERLFPGTHRVVAVLPSLAWPHIAGARYWAARGAEVVVPSAGRSFMQRVLARRWTLHPDTLERSRGRAATRVVGVSDSLVLAGGAVRIYGLGGVDGEGALLVYLRSAGLVWASDHIQIIRQPSIYTAEVWRTARDRGLAPRHTSGPHFRLIPWATLDSLYARSR